MADAKALEEALKTLASLGVSYGDVQKALKGMKASGEIKSTGRGKVPSDDPLRLSLKSAILSINIEGTPLLTAVDRATKTTTSFMLTLSDDWKLNFVKNTKKPKKAKAKTVAPKEMEEPTVV